MNACCGAVVLLLIARDAGASPDAVFAQAPRRTRRSASIRSRRAFSGRVTTADTGAPIRGAEVRLSMDGRFSRLVTTNGEGRFELRNLPAGDYRLTVSKTGFITLEFGQRRPFETRVNDHARRGSERDGQCRADQRRRDLRPRARSIRRSIGRHASTGSAHSCGRRRPAAAPCRRGRSDRRHRCVSRLWSASGRLLRGGEHGTDRRVKRDPPVYYPGTMSFAEAQPITLGAGAEASADFQIVEVARAATVSGVVLNSSGAPAPGAMVNLSSNTSARRPARKGSPCCTPTPAPTERFRFRTSRQDRTRSPRSCRCNRRRRVRRRREMRRGGRTAAA